MKSGMLRSIVDFQAAINPFLAKQNTEPKPFAWTANPNKIAAAV